MKYEYPKYMTFTKEEEKDIQKGTNKANKYLRHFIRGVAIGFLLFAFYIAFLIITQK